MKPLLHRRPARGVLAAATLLFAAPCLHAHYRMDLAGSGPVDEVEYVPALTLMGLPPAAVLRAATINGANALGVGSLLGTVEPGKLADLFVVDGNPLVDVRAVRNGRWVMVRGELYDVDALFDAVRGKIGPRSAAEVDTWGRSR